MKKPIFSLNKDNLASIAHSVDTTINECYVGDLSCMIDESDPVVSIPDNKKTIILNDGKYITTSRLIQFLCETVDEVKTIGHVITMSKFEKFIKKNELMKTLYSDTTFHIVWGYIGHEICDTIDSGPDVKIIYLPKLMIPKSVVSLYSKNDSDVYYNLILMVVPEDFKDSFRDSRNWIGDMLKKMASVAIYKKCRNLIVNVPSITKEKDTADSVIDNMVKDPVIIKYIDSITKLGDTKIQIHSIYEMIEFGRF